MRDEVKVLGLAVGNDEKQIEAYKKDLCVSFPIVPDRTGEVYYALGIPTLPFMIITNPEGKLLMTHRGILEDPDHMLREIREIHGQH